MESTDHLDFITATDRKSLYTQIKELVAKAKEIANEELDERRKDLQMLLDFEDKIYEEEFANKVKSRIDEDIKERKNVLLKIKEESEKSSLEFLESMRKQQYMEGCYEIREALRRKEMENVKICQLEQIRENQRAGRRNKELDKYWERVQRMNLDREDERQRNENCLKRKLALQVKNGLDVQMMEMEAKREEERCSKAEDADKLAKLLEEIRLEEFELQHRGMPEKTLAYRNELLDVIEQRKAQRCAEERERAEMHCKMIADLQRLEAEESAAAHQRKRATHQATMEYIAYVKRMRRLEEEQQQMRDARIDDLYHVDICTKSNIQRELARKAEIAALCHAELKRQICEEYERRLRDATERRECKILENRFARKEITREEILEQRRKNRAELDKQVEELKRIRAEEELKYKDELKRASNDPVFCAQLAEQYIRDGVDYLDPHANWRILACPQKEYVAKARGAGGDAQPEDEEQKQSTCIETCGRCTKRGKIGDGCGC